MFKCFRCCVSIHLLPYLHLLFFLCISVFTWQNAVLCKYPDGVFITAKKLSVEHWTLVTLSGRHLGYAAEEDGPVTS